MLSHSYYRRLSVLLALLASFALACGDDDGGTDSGTDSGTATDSGTDSGTGSTATLCQEECVDAEDCAFASGESGYSCVGDRCVPSCADNDDCLPFSNGWFALTACTSGGGECGTGFTCIDIDGAGTGRCVSVSAPPCTAPSVEKSLTDIDAATVMACVSETLTCSGDVCGASAAFDCNESGCTTGFTCNTTSNQCECDDNAACMALNRGDTCNSDGDCECAAASECTATQLFSGTTFVCE